MSRMPEAADPTVVWQEVQGKPLTLEAGMAFYPGCFTLTGMREHHMDPVVAWCAETNCGRRTAFNMFRFRNRKEMSMFLLRWS